MQLRIPECIMFAGRVTRRMPEAWAAIRSNELHLPAGPAAEDQEALMR
jgi:hypothetical protein